MTDFVPADQVRRLAHSAESFGEVFGEGTPARRLGQKLADDIRDCVDKHAIPEQEVRDAGD
jgi:hypothetical protein